MDIYVDDIGNSDDKTVSQQQVYGLDGNDEYRVTSALFSRIYGGDGSDDLTYLGTASANIYGGEGIDFCQGGGLGDAIYGGDGVDVLLGEPIFTNSGGDDYLDGGRGDDFLIDGVGADVMVGGPGLDDFSFTTSVLAGTAPNRILDFKPADDTISLFDEIFLGIGTTVEGGEALPLKSKNFFIGGKAKDANDRIGYNKKNGDLIYDANGDKKGGKIIFCELDAGLKVTKADFEIF